MARSLAIAVAIVALCGCGSSKLITLEQGRTVPPPPFQFPPGL